MVVEVYAEDAHISQTVRPLFIVMLGLAAILILLVFAVLTFARARPIPRLLNLPQAYRPGSLLPENLRCPGYGEPQQYWYDAFCWVDYQGQPVYFEFDYDRHFITRSIIPAQDYTLGQSLVSWGKPMGVNWNQYTAYIYWQTHWTILESGMLQPHSPVKIVMYTLDQPSASPWRGFRPTPPQPNLEVE